MLQQRQRFSPKATAPNGCILSHWDICRCSRSDEVHKEDSEGEPFRIFVLNLSTCLCLLINFPFPLRSILLIAISLFIADLRSGNSSTYTNFTGPRVRV